MIYTAENVLTPEVTVFFYAVFAGILFFFSFYLAGAPNYLQTAKRSGSDSVGGEQQNFPGNTIFSVSVSVSSEKIRMKMCCRKDLINVGSECRIGSQICCRISIRTSDKMK